MTARTREMWISIACFVGGPLIWAASASWANTCWAQGKCAAVEAIMWVARTCLWWMALSLMLFAVQAQACDPESLSVVNTPRGQPYVSAHPRTGEFRWEQWFDYALKCGADTIGTRAWPMRCAIGEPEPDDRLQAIADIFGANYLAGQREEHCVLYGINDKACAWMEQGMTNAWERFARGCLAIGHGITAQQVQAEWAAAWEPLPVDATELAARYAQLLELENTAAFIAAVIRYVEMH